MKLIRFPLVVRLALVAVLAFSTFPSFAQMSRTVKTASSKLVLSLVAPETVGFSSQRLENLHAVFMANGTTRSIPASKARCKGY
jgi:hypothetical protein